MAANDPKSKKPSDASSDSTPLERITFFLDRSLGRLRVAAALRSAGLTVEVHDDHFPENAPDETWLRAVGAKGWVVLTKDARIRFREIERAALLNAGVRAFVLTNRGDLNAAEMADTILMAKPAIARLLDEFPPPFIARVGQSGTAALLVVGIERPGT